MVRRKSGKENARRGLGQRRENTKVQGGQAASSSTRALDPALLGRLKSYSMRRKNGDELIKPRVWARVRAQGGGGMKERCRNGRPHSGYVFLQVHQEAKFLVRDSLANFSLTVTGKKATRPAGRTRAKSTHGRRK